MSNPEIPEVPDSTDPSTRPSQLILIRHGESMRNLAKKGTVYFADEEARRMVRGIPDHKIALTDDGWNQARETGYHLREKFGAPDYFYHSGYERTLQTLQGILEAYDPEDREFIKIRMNHFLRERDPGHTYDMTTSEAEHHFPWLHEYWKTFGGFFSRPPGGESLADVTQRFYLFLNMLFRERGGQKVWVTLHGGTLRCARFLLERWTYDDALSWKEGQNPENCGVTVYEFNPALGRLELKEYNTVYWK